MRKRPKPNLKAIRAARSYTVPECAETVGVTIGTVRVWMKQGLPAMTASRPYLITGEALREFHEGQKGKQKVQLGPEQFYCMSCKAPRDVAGRMVDFTPHSIKTARLTGLCAVCGRTCHRMVARSRLPEFCEIFDVACREGPTA